MWRIPRSVDYSMLILLTLYERQSQGLLSATAIACHNGLPAQQVAKLLKQLQRKELVTSSRGAKGGYALGKMAGNLSLAQVFEAVEGPLQLTGCIGTGPCECGALPNCRLKPYVAGLNQQLVSAMSQITLAGVHAAQMPFLATGAAV